MEPKQVLAVLKLHILLYIFDERARAAMGMVYKITCILSLALGISHGAMAKTLTSPNGIIEQCWSVPPSPHGVYSVKDTEKEQELCSFDFYSKEILLCGKNWSTSPSTLLLKTTNAVPLIQSLCMNKKSMEPVSKVAKFKVSMNEKGTSGTFSISSLLYYHLSRDLNLNVIIPVSVLRTMDKQAHYQMVTSKVQFFENDMIQKAWNYLAEAESVNPQAIRPVRELFTENQNAIYGALIDSLGNEKYTEFFRGRKQPLWGLAQHQEMLKTPVFKALASPQDLSVAAAESIKYGLENYKADFNGVKPSLLQMISWMQDASEMSLLDFIMQQQDRPGNIHFQWRIEYFKNGQFKSNRIKTMINNKLSGLEKKYPRPEFIKKVESIAFSQAEYSGCNKEFPCAVVQKTTLEDNDAGGRIYYLPFYRQAQILEKINHISARTYQNLIRLARSMKNQDDASYNYYQSRFLLDSDQFNQLKKNMIDAAEIMKKKCEKGELKFDLNYQLYLEKGQIVNSTVPCY